MDLNNITWDIKSAMSNIICTSANKLTSKISLRFDPFLKAVTSAVVLCSRFRSESLNFLLSGILKCKVINKNVESYSHRVPYQTSWEILCTNINASCSKVVDTTFPVIVMYYSWLHMWDHMPVGTSVRKVSEESDPSSESYIKLLFLTWVDL